MSPSDEHVGLKILAKIKIYILTRAQLLFHLCYEIPCMYYVLLEGVIKGSQGFKATLERYKQISLGKVNMLVDFQRSTCKNKVAFETLKFLYCPSTTYLPICVQPCYMYLCTWVYVSRRRMCSIAYNCGHQKQRICNPCLHFIG